MRVTRTITTLAALGAALGLAVPVASAQETVYQYERTEVQTTGYEHDSDMVRFRFGVSGVGGGMVNGPEIAGGGLELRAGIQIGDAFAVYYMPVGLIGAFIDRPFDGDTTAGALYNTAMVDITLFDLFTFGAGPSIDFVWGCSDLVQTEVDCEASDAFFGSHGRLALNLMPVMGGMGTRHALTISFDVHPTVFSWDNETVGVTMLGGIGYEMM